MTATENRPFPVPDTGVRERGTRGNGRAERGADLFIDIASLLRDGLPDPPTPVILTRDDGHSIFYAGQVNALFGEAESGKTMIAMAAVAEVAKAGSRVMFVDIDHNGVEATVARLLALGVPEQFLADPSRFRYYAPEDKADLLDLVAFLQQWRPVLMIVDSVGELLPMFGASSNNPDDFTDVHAKVLKPVAATGSCVVIIDHLAKNAESKAAGPTGTAAKRRALGGVSIRVKVKDQFVPGHGGSAWLTINKDRHGGLRRRCPLGDREPSAGLFELKPDGDQLDWNLRRPSGADAAQISNVDLSDLDALDQLDPPPSSVADVKARMHWRSERAGDALRVWRSRSPGSNGERGTGPGDDVPHSQPPVWGTGNVA